MSKPNKKSYLLEAIQTAILLSGKTDFEIAKAVGCASVQTISNVRRNKHVPNVVLCERLYETLTGFSLNDFDL